MHGGSGPTRMGPNGIAQPQPSVLGLPARWKGNQPAGAGLSNLGNSCYLNSILQCLAYVPPLAYLCLGHMHSASCSRVSAPASAVAGPLRGTDMGPATPCTFCIMERQLVALLRGSRAVPVSPAEVVRNLHLFSRSFVRGRQEDSHELLTAVLDVMERDSRRVAVALGAPKGCRTIVEDLFVGRWQSQVRCLVCGHESNTYESFATLPLDIGQARSVTEGLRAFTEAERLDGNNKYKCDKCRKLVPAMKQTTIWDDPNVLVVQLKRFNGGSLLGKITRHVAFTETVELQPFMTPPAARRRTEQQQHPQQQDAAASNGHDHHHHHHHHGQETRMTGHAGGRFDDRQHQHQQYPHQHPSDGGVAHGGSDAASRSVYTLTSVLVHQGTSMHSGHYYAFIRDSYGSWSCMNDSHVYGRSLEEVRQEQAYLLFYTRQSMKLPRPAPVPPPQPAAATATVVEGPSPPPSRAATVVTSGSAAAAGPVRPVYGPQLPPGCAAPRSAAAAHDTAALPGAVRESPLSLRPPSLLNPARTGPAARLPAKVIITPKVATSAADANTSASASVTTNANGATSTGTAGIHWSGAAAAAAAVSSISFRANGSPTCRFDTPNGPTNNGSADASTPVQVAAPLIPTRASGTDIGDASTAPLAAAAAGVSEARKRGHGSDGGANEPAAAAGAAAIAEAAASGGADISRAGGANVNLREEDREEDIHERVKREAEGLKACAFYKKGIKRLRQSVEDKLRESSLVAAMREAVQSMVHSGLSLDQVLTLGHGDPRRKALDHAMPAGVLQYGMEELRKLLGPLLTPEGPSRYSLQ